MTPEMRKRLERLHARGYIDPAMPRCQYDGFPWPCDVDEVLGALAEAEQREAALVEALDRASDWIIEVGVPAHIETWRPEYDALLASTDAALSRRKPE